MHKFTLHRHLWKKYLYINDDINESIDNKCINSSEFIIGAGLMRTGTSSLQVALNILGYNCYHNRDCIINDDGQLWTDIAQIKLKKINEIEKQRKNKQYDRLKEWRKYTLNENELKFDEIFGDKYNGSVDKPGQLFYLDLLKYYKNIQNRKCKIILTVRDDENQWYNSLISSIGHYSNTLQKKIWLFMWIYNDWKWEEALMYGTFCEHQTLRMDLWEQTCKEWWISSYNDWNKSVENNVDIIGKDNLLIFNIKQGWKPLCKFLNKPIPNVAFPKTNQGLVMRNMAKKLIIYDRIITIALILIICVIIYVLYRLL